MKQAKAQVKTSKINRAPASGTALELAAYCGDLQDWPRSWMGWEKDLPPGARLVMCFQAFLQHLISSGLSRKTIRRHGDNLWKLGGEIIRDLHQTPSLRRRDMQSVLRDCIHEDGGPLLPNGSPEEQQSFDATCRKLHQFLAAPRR